MSGDGNGNDGDPPPPAANPAAADSDELPDLVSDDASEFSASDEELDDDGMDEDEEGWEEDVDDELDEMEEQALLDEAWMGAPGVPGMMQAFLGLGGGGGDPDDEDDDPWGWGEGEGMDAEFFWDEEWDSEGEPSDASTVEPEDEAAAANHAAEVTAGRHIVTPPAAYALPSATFHFQSADAMATAPDPARPGATLVATMDSDGVLLFSMSSAGALRRLGGPPAPMRFLGGFESPALSAYSLQLSPNGRLMAAGGDEGSLEIYFVDPTAPQRPPVPAATIDDMATHQPFFYLPIIPPDADWVSGERPARVAREIHELLTATDEGSAAAEAAAGQIPRGYPRTRNDAEFLHILGFRDTAFLAPPLADALAAPERPHGSAPVQRPGLGWVPSDPFFAAAVEDQARGLEHQFREFAANVVGGRSKIDWVLGEGNEEEVEAAAMETEEPAAEDEAGPSTRRTRSRSAATNKKQPPKKQPPKQRKKAEEEAAPAAPPAVRGAVSLGALLVLGFPTEEEARNATMNHEGMVNGVRFGLVAGRQRLVAAEQSGRIYVFESPEIDGALLATSADLPAAMMCASLGEPSPHWSTAPVVAFHADPTPLGASLRRRGTVLSTATLGPFGVPLNLAVPSPDGRWIAAVGDQKCVLLLDQSDGFAPRELPFDVLRFDPDLMPPQSNEAGAQYAAWNASSTLLAVTSDALHAVFLFDIPSGQMVMRVEGFVRAVLPCVWAPWDDSVLLFAEESKLVHVLKVPAEVRGGGAPCIDSNAREDLAEPGPGSQLVRLRENPRRPRGGRRRVTGMGVSAEGDLLVATKQGTAYRFLSATEWTPETHAGWPAPFKVAVRQVLLGAGREGCLLADLPQAMVMRVVAALAGRRVEWLEVVEGNEAVQEGGDAAPAAAAAADGGQEAAPQEPAADAPAENEGGGE